MGAETATVLETKGLLDLEEKRTRVAGTLWPRERSAGLEGRLFVPTSQIVWPRLGSSVTTSEAVKLSGSFRPGALSAMDRTVDGNLDFVSGRKSASCSQPFASHD